MICGRYGDLPSRFWPRVEKTETCWIWRGAIFKRWGYGYIKVGKKHRRAHRVAYELCVGTIPEGLSLDHLCRNRLCVNPAHLEPVTHRENVLRGVGITAKHARQTHCLHGHPFDATNTIHKDGGRICRICDRANKRNWYRRKFGAHPRRFKDGRIL